MSRGYDVRATVRATGRSLERSLDVPGLCSTTASESGSLFLMNELAYGRIRTHPAIGAA